MSIDEVNKLASDLEELAVILRELAGSAGYSHDFSIEAQRAMLMLRSAMTAATQQLWVSAGYRAPVVDDIEEEGTEDD